MGYIKIPSIDVSLLTYHSTDEGVLQVGVGHVEGTSLPVGGAGTHSMLSRHCGLPLARLFTDINKLVIVAPLVAVPILLILLISLLVSTRKKRRNS